MRDVECSLLSVDVRPGLVPHCLQIVFVIGSIQYGVPPQFEHFRSAALPVAELCLGLLLLLCASISFLFTPVLCESLLPDTLSATLALLDLVFDVLLCVGLGGLSGLNSPFSPFVLNVCHSLQFMG